VSIKKSQSPLRDARKLILLAATFLAIPTSNALAQSSFFRGLGEAVGKVLPADNARSAVLSSGIKVVFGKETYAVFGRDECPVTHDIGCVVAAPGASKAVILDPIGTNTRLDGAIYFAQEHGATNIFLTAVSYPDERTRNFSPPLIGVSP